MADKIDLAQYLREGKLEEGFYLSRDSSLQKDHILYVFPKDNKWYIQTYWNTESPLNLTTIPSFYAEKLDDPFQAIRDKKADLIEEEKFIGAIIKEIAQSAREAKKNRPLERRCLNEEVA